METDELRGMMKELVEDFDFLLLVKTIDGLSPDLANRAWSLIEAKNKKTLSKYSHIDSGEILP